MRTVANEDGNVNNDSDDRAEFLAVWLADAPSSARDADKAIALAKRFLERRPDSPLADEARMKLGEMYFQSGDYPDAQTQLELLVKKSPGIAAGRGRALPRGPGGVAEHERRRAGPGGGIARRGGAP